MIPYQPRNQVQSLSETYRSYLVGVNINIDMINEENIVHNRKEKRQEPVCSCSESFHSRYDRIFDFSKSF